ncbi:MAG: YihY/virulence factor BrkB family protein [Nocardioides sp.]|uniref:YihY/virulence factor BrkB family protein n=1 Tax=Nocardioides sp. TaxID=35761 RepID=UPI003EFE497D
MSTRADEERSTVEEVRERASQARSRAEELRRKHPRLSRVIATGEQFGAAQATQHAGAVTYFGLLSFFPLLAIAFFAVGYISQAYPDAENTLLSVLNGVLPDVFGPEEDGKIPLSFVQDAGSAVGAIGLVALLYSGLGWLSAMRKAVAACFDESYDEQPGFVVGKLRDLVSMVVLGLVLLVSVAASSLLRAFGEEVLDFLSWSSSLGWVVQVVTWLLGLATSVLLFWAIFRVLARPKVPGRALLQGALVGGVGFELLKWLSGYLLAATREQPAFQAFGIALILLVWINWFARVALFAACWAYTAPEAVSARAADPRPEAKVEGPHLGPAAVRGIPAGTRAQDEPWTPGAAFAVGAGAMLGLVAVLRRIGR